MRLPATLPRRTPLSLARSIRSTFVATIVARRSVPKAQQKRHFILDHGELIDEDDFDEIADDAHENIDEGGEDSKD